MEKVGRLKQQVMLLAEREQMYHKQLLVLSEAFGALFNSCERVTLKWKDLKESGDPAVEKFLEATELIELRAYLEGLQETQYRLAPASNPDNAAPEVVKEPETPKEPEADAGDREGGDHSDLAGEASGDEPAPVR